MSGHDNKEEKKAVLLVHFCPFLEEERKGGKREGALHFGRTEAGYTHRWAQSPIKKKNAICVSIHICRALHTVPYHSVTQPLSIQDQRYSFHFAQSLKENEMEKGKQKKRGAGVDSKMWLDLSTLPQRTRCIYWAWMNHRAVPGLGQELVTRRTTKKKKAFPGMFLVALPRRNYFFKLISWLTKKKRPQGSNRGIVCEVYPVRQ